VGVKEYSSKVGLWPDKSSLYMFNQVNQVEVSRCLGLVSRLMDSRIPF